MRIQTINPATEAVIKTYTLLTKKEMDQKIQGAADAFLHWKKTPIKLRQKHMLSMVQCLESGIESLAALMASEMGKPLEAGRLEIKKCMWACQHYANQAEHYLAPESIQTEHKKSFVCYEPLGVIFAIMPWNYPFWQVFRFAAPNLMAGNVGLLRHAAITTGCGNAIEELFDEAGFPHQVFQHLIINHEMAAQVIENEHVKGVTLTGSEAAGRIIAKEAGAHLKKSVLELGGSDPYIVLADADLSKAADVIVAARLGNTGQTCIAAKRIIVMESVFQPLLDKIMLILNTYVMGDPCDPQTKLGPMARADLREAVHQQVVVSIQKGAECVLGGVIPDKKGFYYPVTVLTGVKPGMPVFDEEVFGPVFAMISAKDEHEALRLANQTPYGLGAAIFTQNIQYGEDLAMRSMHAGSCCVNGMVSSDPRLPFGGVKHSGFGRELGKEGMVAFMNMKTVVIHE